MLSNANAAEQKCHGGSGARGEVAAEPAQLLDLRELFPTPAPLEVDLGCGDGSFIAALAADSGAEFSRRRATGRAGAKGCRKIAALALTNARILRVDIGTSGYILIPARIGRRLPHDVPGSLAEAKPSSFDAP